MSKILTAILLFIASLFLISIISTSYADEGVKQTISRIEEVYKEHNIEANKAIEAIKKVSSMIDVSKLTTVEYRDRIKYLKKLEYIKMDKDANQSEIDLSYKDDPLFTINKVCKPCAVCPTPKQRIFSHLGASILGGLIGSALKKRRVITNTEQVIRYVDKPTPTTTPPTTTPTTFPCQENCE